MVQVERNVGVVEFITVEVYSLSTWNVTELVLEFNTSFADRFSVK